MTDERYFLSIDVGPFRVLSVDAPADTVGMVLAAMLPEILDRIEWLRVQEAHLRIGRSSR